MKAFFNKSNILSTFLKSNSNGSSIMSKNFVSNDFTKKIIEKLCGNIFAKSYINNKSIIGFEIPTNNKSENLCLNFA